MRSWQEELLHTTEHADSKESLFLSIEASAKALGFEHCAYGLRVPVPVSNPRTVLLNNYPITHLADESPSLTDREVEVLKWTADGKTSGEIADILAVSDNTVNFHIKNAITKLRTANKTAAAVRAAMLGLFN